jgi:2-oxoglutarate dehydrogenase E2 component (dihydrolipoamide succinyltransferase)
VDIKVPAAGESITSANVAAWQKKDGDQVEKGEALVTLETDKVSNEVEAPVSGTIEILVPEGEEVEIGKVIARITPGASAASKPSEPKSSPKEETSKPKEEASKKKEASEPAAESRQKPDLSVVPTPDSEPKKSEPVKEGRTTRRKMSMLRRKIATHLVNAQQTAAILTTFNEVDMTAVMNLRKSVQEDFVKKHGVKLGFMSFFVKAVTQALKDVPSINGRIEGNEVIENHFYDIGVAIGTEKGLIVPVLRDCDEKSFAQIEQDILDYAAKGKSGKITIEDLQGGVFTISNGGVYGSLLSTPILNPPQSGILGMHTIQQRPIAVDGKVEIRPMMYLAMSYDHRLVDGKEAVTFLIRIKDCLEAPHRLMLEL